MSVQIKDPGTALNFALDWSAFLPGAETISSVTSVVTPAGELADAPTKTSTTTIAALSGGVRGRTYRVSHKIVMSDSNTAVRGFDVRVENL